MQLRLLFKDGNFYLGYVLTIMPHLNSSRLNLMLSLES